MKILITGSSKGIGLAVSKFFLDKGYEVVGIDLLPSSIDNLNYKHYICDIQNYDDLPNIEDIDYLFNNAGLQNSKSDIQNNLIGTMNVTKKYGFQKSIKSILFNASASASSGFEFEEYVASKAGIVGYMKTVAYKAATSGATCNSLSLGGVLTDSNDVVMNDPKLWKQIMDVTPLKKWTTLDEVCEWVYFLLVTNKSMSGQDILVDNGERDLNCTFVWPT